jgi:hypothetical protein
VPSLTADVPSKFAPGIVTTNKDDSCFEISSSGKEMVFNRENAVYLVQQDASGKWGDPAVIFDSGDETSFAPDGTKIYFNA